MQYLNETYQRLNSTHIGDRSIPISLRTYGLYKSILMLLLVCIVNIHVAMATDLMTAVTKSQAIDQSWSYHLGDLPRNDGEWAFDVVDWKSTATPDNFPDRSSEHIVWLKISLPHDNWRDPTLFVSSIDLTAQVYIDGKSIYSFGDIDSDGNSEFAGWPWHAIGLPLDYYQHEIYFRVFSDYPYIGLAGDIILGERSSLLDTVYKQGVTGIIFVIGMLLIGFTSMVLGLIKKDKWAAISIGALSFDLALMMLSENELSQVIWFNPLAWRYIAAFSYFLIPALLATTVSAWLKSPKQIITNIVLMLSLSFVIGVAGLTYFTEFSFVNAYPVFDVLFILLVSLLMLGNSRKFISLNISGILMLTGIIALLVSLLLDMLSAHGFISWIGHSGQWGLLIFTVTSLAIYLVQDWRQQIALKELTFHLELEVFKRTEQLEFTQRELRQLARIDDLTQLLNRRAFTEIAEAEISKAVRYSLPVSILMLDIDNFKNINDEYGHETGDQALIEIAEITRKVCREGEPICRFGGEEFLILPYAMNVEYIETLANRIRDAIRNHEFEHSGHQFSLTASFGVISADESSYGKQDAGSILKKLISDADKLMYEAKEKGRDRIELGVITS